MTEQDNLRQDAARIAVTLRAKFFAHPGYDAAHERCRRLMDLRRAELEFGLSKDTGGIAVIGESGSGKTTAVQRILSQIEAPGMEEGDIHQISVRVPTPATQKDLARAILQALEFPVARGSTASRMWDLVIHHLRLRKCQLIHLDEAQELGGRGSDGEKAAVINSLKSLMQIRNWPVILLLSGTPDLDQLIAQAPQLLRRFSIIRFLSMTEFYFREHVASLIAGYAGHAGMMQAAELRDAKFVPRLLHAGREHLGIVIELTIGAIFEALLAGRQELRQADFAQFYTGWTGCTTAQNPFVAADFRSVQNGHAGLTAEIQPKPKRRR